VSGLEGRSMWIFPRIFTGGGKKQRVAEGRKNLKTGEIILTPRKEGGSTSGKLEEVQFLVLLFGAGENEAAPGRETTGHWGRVIVTEHPRDALRWGFPESLMSTICRGFNWPTIERGRVL